MWVLPMQERALAKDVDATLTQLAKLTGVRTLRLHRQKIIPACTLAVLAASFQGVTELVMMLRFPAQADALGFVCAFPALEALHFECVRTPPGEVPPAELRLPVGLRSVVLHGVRGHERWFADNRVEHLAELSVEKVRAQEDKARLDELLALFGAGLRRLTLRFEPLKNEDEVTVDLRHSTALRVLELDLSALTRKHIFPALASLRAPHIERIVWRNRRVLGGDAEVWAGLDALLVDQEAFPALTKFEVVAGKGRGERLNPRLWMPRCKARGILGGEVDIILSF
ncbi:hypothetical protein FB451DRAFT_1373437 [Mycena latifolia]|nr:hypothetical protein FB451DRAFT_1373437 [Mycena latifolia]